ncbi:MAG TPA: DUF427 domain-containing protein [Caulobacteraceae bacterium]|nr:DUF427 domain-containing protein [Caulobacteraceae bacterium]
MDEMNTAWQTLAIRPYPERVQALHNGHLVADTTGAVLVRQAGQDDVFYFPIEDVEMSHLAPTDYRTTSALGEASYFTFSRDGKIWENGVWSYEKPAKGAEELQGLVAFRPEIIEIHFVGHEGGEAMWDREADKMGDYIRHTDSGSGASQQDHWPPTVHNARD